MGGPLTDQAWAPSSGLGRVTKQCARASTPRPPGAAARRPAADPATRGGSVVTPTPRAVLPGERSHQGRGKDAGGHSRGPTTAVSLSPSASRVPAGLSARPWCLRTSAGFCRWRFVAATAPALRMGAAFFLSYKRFFSPNF